MVTEEHQQQHLDTQIHLSGYGRRQHGRVVLQQFILHAGSIYQTIDGNVLQEHAFKDPARGDIYNTRLYLFVW